MPTAIELNGSWFNRSISPSDFQEIKTAKSVNDVSSTWGKIIDWFCGANKEEAKKLLFDVYNNQLSTNQRISSFSNLRDLASAAYKRNFDIEITHEGIKLSIDNDLLKETLQPQANDEGLINIINLKYGNDSTQERINVFKQDIPRADYTISLQDHDYSFTVHDGINQQEKKNAVDSIGKNDFQKRNVSIFATQSLTLAMRGLKPEYLSLGNNHVQRFNIMEFPSGDLKVDMLYSNTTPEHMQEVQTEMGLYSEVKYDASLLISKDKVILLSCSWSGS
ncbi:hypothetical protein [Shewanella surugensis]|uniref:Uncharacterized protein n=1 Tax=Shewanella surugensis TaxID=212020 RepID=A0ABT0LFH3_9GAMM|nr:hypothetical protein [Shewanella surugensis]MCL1126454.1 hypothetical protein [Shewanella surugensis]